VIPNRRNDFGVLHGVDRSGRFASFLVSYEQRFHCKALTEKSLTAVRDFLSDGSKRGRVKRDVLMVVRLKFKLIVFAVVVMGSATLCQGQVPAQTQPAGAAGQNNASAVQPNQLLAGSITGTVVDQSGAVVAKAQVSLTRGDRSPSQEALSDDDGQFSFADLAPGPFQLTVTSSGFQAHTSSGVLHPGEICVLPPIALEVATEMTEVKAVLSPVEVAEEQLKVEEKQRVLAVIPNFYISYVPDAAPLSSKQKFELAWKTTVDPFSFLATGAIAGVEQAQNNFKGYGQGAQGYAKRYGASYADLVSGTFIGGAILPSLLKQDPRYFYKGSGSKRSRAFYAIANAVICKGDNRRWQVNYSNILGSLAAGGISNLYYPAEDRNGAALTIETGLIGIGTTAAVNLLQEFFVRKVTKNAPAPDPAKP
jgi:hypothetical protein